MKILKIGILTIFLNLFVGALAQDVSLKLQKSIKLTEAARLQRWQQLKQPVWVGFGTTAIRYQQDIPPLETLQNSWSATAWKNEKVHTQIVVASKKKLERMSISTEDLVHTTGHRIQSENITVGFVQYVLTDEFGNGCGRRKSMDFDSSWVADIINTELTQIAVASYNTQPIWISIKIPHNARNGKYSGFITVKADKDYRLPITINVINRTLPSPQDWSFRLDYWQHPAAIARVHQVPLWSDKHFELMRKYYTMLAEAGQKIITASIVEEPWNHQTYDDFPSLIQWTKKADGTWKYDYSLFDKYVAFVMSCGINKQINCYSMVPWKIAFKYYDEALQKDTVFTGKIGTPEYNEFWRNMLTDFTAHLKAKGWFNITTIAMDERPMESMQAVIRLLKSIDPEWKVSLAGDYHAEIEKDIFDYCIASKWQYPEEILRSRKQQGKASTWYVCCTEKYPNMFTFSPPDEAVWAGWYTAATRMDGFLRWAFNSWTRSPLTDSRFITWPAGDTYQVYPGPLTSIRFEKLIEGIQDFEKINQLRKMYQQHGETTKLNQLEAALQTFKIERLSKESSRQMIEHYKHLLNE
jgi:hypothetical protein